MIPKYLCLFFLLLASELLAANGEMPRLVRGNDGHAKLWVDGEPFLILGGEVMNSSATTLESIAPSWKRLTQLNLNTVLLPISWQQLEPEEGRFDFSLVQGLISEARVHNLRLIFLWFGSWKNGTSGYAPHWVMRDLKRFPRMRAASGENRPCLSNLSEELNQADARAFTALLRYIKEIDAQQHTVIMCQVENEVGIKGDSRDRSPEAETSFMSAVPTELLRYVEANEGRLLPEIAQRWAEQGRKRSGTWEEVFGRNDLADEMFMAWHYARFVDRIAAAGKQLYPLPMFVNAWTIDPQKPKPGVYPSGGPNHRMLDVWQAAAPNIDVIAVDNYLKDYKGMCRNFYRNGNPMFVPEAVPLWLGDRTSGPAQAFFTFAEFNTICYSPFAIDHPAYGETHALGNAYQMLNSIKPLILQLQGTPRMHGFLQQDAKGDRVDFENYYFSIGYDYPFQGYGLIAQIADDEFLVVGNGITVKAFSKIKGLTGLSYGLIREGVYEKGEWRTTKFLGGDEAGQGVSGLKLPTFFLKEEAGEKTITCIRVRVIPVEATTNENSEAVN